MIKRLSKCIREYKKASLLSPLFVTFEVILEVFIPLLMSEIIDKGVTGGNMSFIVKTGIALVIMAMLSLLCGALSGK